MMMLMNDDRWFFFIFQSTYQVFTLLLHAMTAKYIRKNGMTYAGFFTTIYSAHFFINLTAFTTHFVTVRIPGNTCRNCTFSDFFEPNGSENMLPKLVLSKVHGIPFTMSIARFMITLVYSIDSYILARRSRVLDGYWRRILPITIPIVIGISFISTSQLFYSRSYFAYSEIYDDYQLVYEENLTFITNSTFLVETLLTLITIVTLIGAYYQIMPITPNPRKTMLFITTVVFFIQSLGFVNDAIIQFSHLIPSSLFEFSTFIKPFLSEILTLSLPWLPIVFRKEKRQMLTRTKTQVTPVIIVKPPPESNPGNIW